MSLISCEQDSLEDFSTNPIPSKTVQIGFSTSLSLQSKLNNSKAKVHNYVKEGYTVVISDNIATEVIHENVNLNEILEVETIGDFFVTIYHPSYQKNTLSKEAYFGIDDFFVSIENNAVSYVDLDLVQGFIIVGVDNGNNDNVNSVSISWQEVELDVIYYTDMTFTFVVVNTKTDGTYRGFNRTVIGEGVHFIIPNVSVLKELKSNKLL